MTKPMISVIVPTYHRNELLKRCLECLLYTFQTLNSDLYEVIITDDGWQNTARNLVETEFPNFRWVAGPKKGPAANRNNGVKHARGKYIVFTDDDCLPDFNWLAAFTADLTPGIDVYEGKTVCKEGIHSPLQHSPMNLNGGYLWSCNMMVTKSLFLNIGGFDEAFPYPAVEDIDFRERIKEAGCQIKFVETAVVDHPPRRMATGKQLGANWESVFYYYAKTSKYSNDIRYYILIKLIDEKVHRVVKMPLSCDIPLYLISMLYEMGFVVLNLNRWKSKYLHLLKDTSL